jgi:cell division septal protein FtsQ
MTKTYELDVETLARALPTHSENDGWGIDMHNELRYSFGTIHEKRCIPTAKKILAQLSPVDEKP